MKILIALFVLGSTAAMAQVSGPLVSGPKDELKTGTFHAPMCAQLGIRANEL